MLLAFLTAQAALADAPMMLFFDSGTAEIRREWEPVLDAAAATARAGARLEITGHSDTPGSPSVNLRISRQRAEIVIEALRSRGVAATAIVIQVAGEERPLVPTADGVREIQNRRVEIRPLP